MIDGFYKFMEERQRIWYKKEILKLEFPWTDDPILRDYKFCNNCRESDRGSIYLIDRVINNASLTLEEKVFNIFVYRFFNVYGLFENIFESTLNPRTFEVQKYEKILEKAMESNIPIWSNAYIICQAIHDRTYGKRGKHIQVLLALKLLSIQINEYDYVGELKEVSSDHIEALRKITLVKMVGSFLGGQILLDLTYLGIFKFGGNDFCVIGPGASKGIEMMTGKSLSNQDMIEFCMDLRKHQGLKLPSDWEIIAYKSPYHKSQFLSLMNIQHVCCEYRKYLQWSNGQGKSKYYKQGVSNENKVF